jgi:hypothetical protein
MKILIGIDPGASGGIAYEVGGFASARAMPDTGGVISFVKAIVAEANGDPVRAVVEEVGGYMGEDQPASRAFEFGRGYGYLLGILQTLEVRVELVRPQAWQKVLGLGNSGRTRAPKGASAAIRKSVRQANARAKAEWKRKLKEKASQLYPKLDVTLKTCDALLLLEYGRRTAT